MNLLKVHYYAKRLATSQELLDKHINLLAQGCLHLTGGEYSEDTLPIVLELKDDIRHFEISGEQDFLGILDFSSWSSLESFEYRTGSGWPISCRTIDTPIRLREWPILPNTVKRIFIENADMETVGRIPPNLEQLALLYSCNNIVELPDDLPDTIISLSLSGTRITHLPLKLPDMLNSLTLPSSLTVLPAVWNDNKDWSLGLHDLSIHSVETLPSNIRYMELGDTDILVNLKKGADTISVLRCAATNPIIKRWSDRFDWTDALTGVLGHARS